MRILLLGASGFIGRELAAALARRGHAVVAAVRAPEAVPAFACDATVAIDLNRDVSPQAWLPRLAGIDAVVNCAGILQGSRSQSIDAIHARAPIALFQACESAGVRRVVQVSAISAERDAGTAYAITKLAADDYLRASGLEWVVLRPSLVHARGAYGGTSLLRALAAFPFAIPMPGDGGQQFQPIHVEDLARVLVVALETDALVRKTVDPAGPDVVSLRTIVVDYRRWLGFAPAPVVAVPAVLVGIATWLGDKLGGPLNATARAQLEYGNAGDYEAFRRATGIEAMGWRKSLALHPAHAQDRWHARLYFLRPLLRVALAVVWLVSAVAGVFALREWALVLSWRVHIPVVAAGAVLFLACALDVVLAALVVTRWKPRTLAFIQALVIVGYTAAATVLWPSLWAEALGPIVKNLAVLGAVLALGAIEEER